ncbi:hypothetical protein CCACVL1_29819 [Corchorus capsularis]|uniref:Uncharacterized protein n=1 Tax=Corchorus capsularis TaxID=210143 RepID=A0A1R3FZX7_COCAP|nr:hypothetical protein CCACVL1_29819 [Corchorus capsularis]
MERKDRFQGVRERKGCRFQPARREQGG